MDMDGLQKMLVQRYAPCYRSQRGEGGFLDLAHNHRGGGVKAPWVVVSQGYAILKTGTCPRHSNHDCGELSTTALGGRTKLTNYDGGPEIIEEVS
jgi:hypothetical protein